MKKIMAVLSCFLCFLLLGCNGNVLSKLPAQTEETAPINGQFGVQLEKKPLRMLNLDGELYFDSGLISNTEARCGTLDRILEKFVEIGEVPKESGTANFDCDGCQLVTKITCEVPVDGKWLIFKKFENQAGETKKFTNFPYCYYIKGRLNNAAIDSELAILTDDTGITFSEIFEPMLSSGYLPDAPKKAISYDLVQSGDKWGITCLPKEVTNIGMTILIEQFGGELQGGLIRKGWFSLCRMEEDEWVPVATNPLIDFTWEEALVNPVSHNILPNDITEHPLEWKWLYGELSSGYYRLDIKIMEVKGEGDFQEEIYPIYFTIE